MNAKYVLAFGAEGVQACLTAPFFLMFVHKVYLEGVNADQQHIGDILASAGHLGRHTSVLLMRHRWGPAQGAQTIAAASKKLVIEDYRWTHSTLRPWGTEIPIQCPTCGALGSLKCKQGQHGAVIVRCHGQDCKYTHTHEKPREWQLVHGGDGGSWAVSTRE